MDGGIPLITLKFLLARKHKLCLCIVADSFLFSDSSSVDCLSLYIVLKYTPLDETHLAVVTGLIH